MVGIPIAEVASLWLGQWPDLLKLGLLEFRVLLLAANLVVLHLLFLSFGLPFDVLNGFPS